MNNLYQTTAATPLSGPVAAPGAPPNLFSPQALLTPNVYNQYQYPTPSAGNPMTAPIALLTNQTVKVYCIPSINDITDELRIASHHIYIYLLS